ncbi:hypothetical protein SAMN02745181_0341 [Rubritalea squalenifaciens DSM 18772]|uniref:Uncharacterized protein n=1 Tax=Rubritalea squalenifaciens DSM 18772 TaxID=1123071 RepID=A0A1M6BYA4_9BACT|nr:hypothetical protein [Rubritalea squalenifaciens]SHI53762.1 hypothetical protein SAMN02745181_0341 [Rubritalea squalenifaciens DSM 18772]
MKIPFPLYSLGLALLLSQCSTEEETVTESKPERRELSPLELALQQKLKEAASPIQKDSTPAPASAEDSAETSSDAEALYQSAYQEAQEAEPHNLFKIKEKLEQSQSQHPDWKPEINQARLQLTPQPAESKLTK